MKSILLTRINTLRHFTDFMRDLGTPVDRELERHSLPLDIDLPNNAYIPVIPAVNFIRTIQKNEQVDDIVFRALEKGIDTNLNNFITSSLTGSPLQLYSDLKEFLGFCHTVAPALLTSINRTKNNLVIRLYLIEEFAEDALYYYEWTIMLQVISIIRKYLGPDWCPDEIRFRPSFVPCNEVHEEYKNTRFVFGHEVTELELPVFHLRTQRIKKGNTQVHPEQSNKPAITPIELDFPTALKLALRNYFGGDYPRIEVAAEIAGTSVRTLQRQLQLHRLNYSKLVEQLRIEIAVELINDTDLNMIDVAYLCGYQHPTHFTRAFRRATGLSPSELRLNRTQS